MSPSKKPATSPDLRQRIFTDIDKLSDRATLSAASSSLKFIAQNLEPSSLPTFLSCILSVDSSSKSPVRVHCLNLLPILAHTHNSSLSPHLPKISASLLRRLRDSDSAVRAACVSASAALSLLDFSAISSPLIAAILSEQDVNSQIGSCLCLKAAVDSAAGGINGADEAELRRVLPKMLKLVKAEGFKAKAALLGAVGSFVAVNDGGVVNGRGGGLVGNVVVCAVEMLSCEDWAARKAAAEVLETVAGAVDRKSGMEFKRFCISSLDSRRFDKVKITRESMNRALEAWREVPGGPDQDQDLLFSPSNPSILRGGASSPSICRRSSFAGVETPKPKKTMNKTRSSLSDGLSSSSTSSIIGLETRLRKKTISKSRRSSLSDDDDSTITTTDTSSVSKTEDGGLRSVSRVDEEDEPERMGGFEVEEDISLIRKQLLQIEKQQSNLLDLLQRFMGNSQNGIDSLETRVNGLERALDEISYDLAIQGGRIPKNPDSSGRSTCCPSTEFLSPKFWRKTEGRSSVGEAIILPMDGYRLQEQNTKNIVRTCSPRSLDVAATSSTFMTPVVRGA